MSGEARSSTIVDALDEQYIVPAVAYRNNFVKQLSTTLGAFLKNAYQFSLSSLVEEERTRDRDVLQIQAAMEKILRLDGNNSTPAIVQQRAELIAVVSNYVDRLKHNEAAQLKDIATQAVMRLFDSLTSISGSSAQEDARKKSLVSALGVISVIDWKMAIMAIAIRRSKWTNSTTPLEFKGSFILDEDSPPEGQKYATGPKFGMYNFAMEIIKQWIATSKESCAMLNTNGNSSSSSSFKNAAKKPVFAEVVIHMLSKSKAMSQSLQEAIHQVLCRYADQYVGESPNAVTIIADREKDWILRAGKRRDRKASGKSNSDLSEDAKIALEFGLSATSIIGLAAEEGFYYGSNRQRHMFKKHESNRKDRLFAKAYEQIAQTVDRKNWELQNNLLTEVGRMVSSAAATATPSSSPHPHPNHTLPPAAAAAPQMPVLPPNTMPNLPSAPIPPSNQEYGAQGMYFSQQQTASPNHAPTVPTTGVPYGMQQQQPSSTYSPHMPSTSDAWKMHEAEQLRQKQAAAAQFAYPGQDFRGAVVPANTSMPPIPQPRQPPQNFAPKHVSFASSYLNPTGQNGSGFATPSMHSPSKGAFGRTTSGGISPMTQNLSKRKPAPLYEDSSGEDSSSYSDTDSSMSDQSDASYDTSDTD